MWVYNRHNMPLKTEVEDKIINQKYQILKVIKDNRKSLTARIKPEDLPVFNQRLKLFGFNSLNELVHDLFMICS